MLNYFPNFFSKNAIAFYIATLLLVSILLIGNRMDFLWIFFGLLEVVAFFYFTNKLTIKWRAITSKVFITKIVSTTLIIRILYIVFSYFFYLYMTGKPFEFGLYLDSLPYHQEGMWMANLLSKGHFDLYLDYKLANDSISDFGFPFLLGCLNWLSGDSILFARLFNALFDLVTVISIYKIAKRNFGEDVARMAAIFVMLMPYMIYFCGMHLKESLMIMLSTLFIERADNILRAKKIPIGPAIAMISIGLSLFLFRTVLAAVLFITFFTALLFSSSKIIGWGRRILTGLLILITLALTMGDSFKGEVEQTWDAKSKNQSQNMEWRSKRKYGNEYAKYMTGIVFAPMILVIPFPTVVNIPNQENQQLINGGNFVKNIMAFFTIIGLFFLFKGGTWREHILPISFMFGYLVIIAFSAFAHSGRFHMPIIPFELLFAAYGLSQINHIKYKSYFMTYGVVILVVILVWSWFKLSGRGLV